MDYWPDPDSAEMGRLVDRWLRSLRAEGATCRQLAGAVQRLARIANRDWQPRTPAEHATLRAFQAWIATTRIKDGHRTHG
jgi:hypothetical protein